VGPFDAALLAAAVALTTPLLLAAIGELFSERAGVLNIGLEGMMLTGAFVSYLVADRSGSLPLAIVAGAGAGALLAVLMAALSIEARADQIVVGIGLNVLALGITSFAFEEEYGAGAQVIVDRIPRLAVPLLSDLPVVGDALFRQNALVYLAYLLVPAAYGVLRATNWGIAVRAAGELPEAADTAGVSVRRVRWLATTLGAGLGAGLGGAYLVVAQTGLFTENMSAGRGFLAFAAVIFARWTPFGVLGACLLFGAADALQLRLQAESSLPAEVWSALAIVAGAAALWLVSRRQVTRAALLAAIAAAGIALAVVAPSIKLPSQLWLAAPYVCALVALAGLVGRARMPRSLAIPYTRGS
jgi:ABC-type uncharacterized transport system permease subunit